MDTPVAPTGQPETPGEGVAERALVTLARDLAHELWPGRRSVDRAGLDGSLDRDWGFDSLSRAELLLRVERAFGTHLPERLLGEAETLRDLVRALAEAKARIAVAPRLAARAPAPEPAERAPETTTTMTDVLDWHASRHGERSHIVLLEGDGGETSITYRQLRERARAVARGLLVRGLDPGERVAIMLPTSAAFFVAFFAVLYAGGVPTPIYPPARPSRIEEHLRRQATILRNARAAMLIAAPEASAIARLLRLQLETLRCTASVDELAAAGADDSPLPTSRRATGTALIQYTSGSTGDPKGVVLSHANLLANIRAMGEAMAASPSDVFVSWLSLYHDMGLIGAWLGSLYFAARLVVMSPLLFLVRPETWLWAIHRHGGTLSAAPNFAFELCLRRIDEAMIAGLDLRSLRMVTNGSEAVSPHTIRRFAERFAAYGFDSRAMAPVYGLAENAVGLAFPPLGRPPIIDRIDRRALTRLGVAAQAAPEATDALEFVACGRPLPGHQIRIVDVTGEVGERQQGRLQFRGPSASSGYLENPARTAELFDGPWLNSGDLAYVASGDVFITGRSKDIVIRAGRHIYPDELEAAVGDLAGVRKGCVVVFGTADPGAGTERLVVIAETRPTESAECASLQRRIEEAATRLLDAPPEEIVLVPPGSVPKTSSGKLRRAATRDLFLKHRLTGRPESTSRQLARLMLSGLTIRLRHGCRLLAGLGYAAWWWTVLVATSAVLWSLVILVPGRSRRWAIVRAVARLLLRLMGVRVELTGAWPRAAGTLLAVNHSSYFDSLVMAAVVPGEPAFVAKRELDAQYAAGPFLRALGALFVERTDPEGGVADTQAALAAAQAGRMLAFFPEGTFTRAYGLRPFHLGAFVIAVQQGLGIVPVTLCGTRSILRDGNWLPRRGDVSVHVGDLIRPDGTDFAAVIRLRDRVRAAILAHTNEPDLGIDARVPNTDVDRCALSAAVTTSRAACRANAQD
ncbi:MAG: AMP-binding protein [Reyranellaceae bacterium]